MAKERIDFKKDYKLFAACEKAESSATVDAWEKATLSPADMEAVAQGIVDDVERNNPLLGTKDKMLRCARLGMIYRDYKELRRKLPTN